MNARRKLVVSAAVAVPLALGGAGTAYAAHYQDRALPGSVLAGTSVAGLTRAEVAEALRQRADAVTVEVTAGDTTTTYSAADLGYEVDVDATLDRLFAANGSWSSYATSLLSSRSVDAVVTERPERTEAVADDLLEVAGAVGRDAAVERSSSGRSYVVVPAVTGRRVDPTSLEGVAQQAARTLESARTTVRFVETAPKVTTAAAKKVAGTANRMIARPVAVSDGEERSVASTAEKASWVQVPVVDGVPGAPTVDVKKVRAWVRDLAADAETEPTTGLRYLDGSGEVRKVMTEAVDGRTVRNADALATKIAARLEAGKSYSGSFGYDAVPATWEERRIAEGAENLAYPAAEGEKWIDVDLGDHTMTAYVGAKVVMGPVSMVDGQAEKPTVTGLFHVYYKNPLMTMRGSNADGTRYETPNVPWSTFFHRGFALHGAPWRDSFGYSASHGCVNLPVDIAKWVYDFAPIGTPVASHA